MLIFNEQAAYQVFQKSYYCVIALISGEKKSLFYVQLWCPREGTSRKHFLMCVLLFRE